MPVLAELRLANGPGRCQGRLEILHNGTWGTVCDDDWDIVDANVVCHQLGCGHAIALPAPMTFGQGSGPIFLDNVDCKGREAALSECWSHGWGIHNCYHYEDVGVVCNGNGERGAREELAAPGVSPRSPGVSRASASFLWGFSGCWSPPGQGLASFIPSAELLPTPASEGPTSSTATASGRSGEGEGLGAWPGWGVSKGRAEQQPHHHHHYYHHQHGPILPPQPPRWAAYKEQPPGTSTFGAKSSKSFFQHFMQDPIGRAAPKQPPCHPLRCLPPHRSPTLWVGGLGGTARRLSPCSVPLQVTAASGW